jgi:hypothetical protein
MNHGSVPLGYLYLVAHHSDDELPYLEEIGVDSTPFRLADIAAWLSSVPRNLPLPFSYVLLLQQRTAQSLH